MWPGNGAARSHSGNLFTKSIILVDIFLGPPWWSLKSLHENHFKEKLDYCINILHKCQMSFFALKSTMESHLAASVTGAYKTG